MIRAGKKQQTKDFVTLIFHLGPPLSTPEIPLKKFMWVPFLCFFFFFEEMGHIHFSANRGLPPSLGRGVCETKSKKKGAPDTEILHARVCSARSGIETMVSDHGL